MPGMNWERANARDRVRTTTAEAAKPKPVVAWWLTVSDWPTRCHECGHRVGVFGWNHDLQRALCEVCLESAGIVATPSKRLLAATRQAERPRKARRARAEPSRPAVGKPNSAALAVACPACHASPGKPCKFKGHVVRTHPSRRRAYKRAS